jgi:hypothetical protein
MLVSSERTVISAHGFEGVWPEKILVLVDPPADAIREARVRLADYEQLCRPLAESDLLVELGQLRSVTKAAGSDATSMSVGFDAMADELAHYPADLVLWALRFWRRTEKFYPTPAELHLLIERRYGGRQAIMGALRKLADKELPE